MDAERGLNAGPRTAAEALPLKFNLALGSAGLGSRTDDHRWISGRAISMPGRVVFPDGACVPFQVIA
jgi:hypothetical protein